MPWHFKNFKAIKMLDLIENKIYQVSLELYGLVRNTQNENTLYPKPYAVANYMLIGYL